MKIDILILDDDVDIFPYYRSVLAPVDGIGHVSFCSDEEEFDEVLSKHKPHLIISDVHMHPKEGPQILRERKDKLHGVNVIMLSCADGLEEETRILRADDVDVVAYLSKPLMPNDLYRILGYKVD